jgi:hypothetical protein
MSFLETAGEYQKSHDNSHFFNESMRWPCFVLLWHASMHEQDSWLDIAELAQKISSIVHSTFRRKWSLWFVSRENTIKSKDVYQARSLECHPWTWMFTTINWVSSFRGIEKTHIIPTFEGSGTSIFLPNSAWIAFIIHETPITVSLMVNCSRRHSTIGPQANSLLTNVIDQCTIDDQKKSPTPALSVQTHLHMNSAS